MTQVKVLFFGVLTDVTQRSELTVSTDGSLEDLRTSLYQQFPALNDYQHQLAVNQEIVKENIALNEGDEIALLPPYAGG